MPTSHFLSAEPVSDTHLSVSWIGTHALVDITLLAVLTLGIYQRQRRNPEMLFALAALNLGLFATLVAISGDAFTTGAGFGLFGMLSLIRLRSASFTSIDMAYAFVTLVLGLLMGLPGLPLPFAAGLATALVLAVLVCDHPRVNPPRHTVRMTLDRAYPSAVAARTDVVSRLDAPVRSVSVEEVDYVRDITVVTVVYSEPTTPVGTLPGRATNVVPARRGAGTAAPVAW